MSQRKIWIVAGLAAVSIAAAVQMASAQSANQKAQAAEFERSFNEVVKPFLDQNCVRCHNVDAAIAGVKVDQLNGALEDRHLKLWEGVRHRIKDGTMPPKGQKQPTEAEREKVAGWISTALEVARLRPAPKNGLVRRLTVAQYRNTLRELLRLEDDLTEALPPDAISKDGFVNNKETLGLSPLLTEAYFEIAEEALKRSIVDPKSKPVIQHFKMELGAGINKNPVPEELILGADSLLLANKDFVVTQPKLVKPFAFDQLAMQTRFRFIEGYQGNDTVRGWREYDSIYHAVFACMRGSHGYPKGKAYSTVPEGLLLRPAIPSDEIFGSDGTYGPKANFKISLRELPDEGRFRVTVLAAKYNDGLLLDSGAAPATGSGIEAAGDLKAPRTVTIPKPGIYQVDVYEADRAKPVPANVSKLNEGLAGVWTMEGTVNGGRIEGAAHFVDSPFGKAISLDGEKDFATVPRSEAVNVGEGDFTVAAWIHPKQLRRAGIAGLGAHSWTHGWFLEMPNDKGTLRLETTGPDTQSNGIVTSAQGVLRADAWQHVAAVVRRGGETRLYVNGYPVAKGQVGKANLDNPKFDLSIGRIAKAQPFKGDLDEVRIYRRALGEDEIQGLVEPGRQFAQPPPEKPQDVTLTIGGREFPATLQQPAFVVLRLDAGPLQLKTDHTGVKELSKVVFTPLAETDPTARRFATFEKRTPRVGVYLGLRRDCGSTLAQVAPPQTVAGGKLTKYVFEGAIRNFPSPDVEKDNVNYLAGVREIGVRSEFTDGREMPRLLIRSVEFEGPLHETWPPVTHTNIFIDSPKKNDPQAYAREVLKLFATRAYRRPITANEEAVLMKVFQKTFSSTGNFQESVRDALQVVLTSPQFLFLIEKSNTPEPEPLDDFELATKLSYFLWNGPPDKRLYQLAATGALRKELNAEVTRMIADPRFARFTQEFVTQWLSLDKFQVLEPDRGKFPKLTRDTKAQLKQEPVYFVNYLMRNNLPVRNLIASDIMMANEVTASYYDMSERTENGFQFMPIAHGRRELGGVLTQAALMAGLSDGRESNPVKRGAWMARRIVSEPPNDPPPNVPALKEDTSNLTLRQRLEQHRNQPGCLQCHMKVDPWGVALEEFDAGGRLKKQPADARSTLPDKTEVSGIYDLKRYLAEDRIDQIAFSVLKHLAIYGTGRSLSYNELNALKKDTLTLRASGYRMGDMIRFVVNSRMFLEK